MREAIVLLLLLLLFLLRRLEFVCIDDPPFSTLGGRRDAPPASGHGIVLPLSAVRGASWILLQVLVP